MGNTEATTGLAKRVENGILGIFVNERTAFLDLLDEESVLVGAGSKVFNGRESFESSPLNPPGILARNVTFGSLYTNRPDEATVVGTYAQKATAGDAPRRLQLRSESGIIFVDPEEIVYAESAGKRSIVHLRDRDVTVCVLLRELCEMLPSQFVRANRFYVVNVRHVHEVGRDGILFSTGESVPIPERRVKEIQLEIASAVSRNFN